MMARGALLGGAVVLAVVLLVLANVIAVQTFDLMATDAGGFVLFVNSIGVMALIRAETDMGTLTRELHATTRTALAPATLDICLRGSGR